MTRPERYDVFARVRAGDDLVRVGRVEAPSDRLARAYARTTFDEEDWDYMAVVRHDDLVAVPTDGEPPRAGADRP